MCVPAYFLGPGEKPMSKNVTVPSEIEIVEMAYWVFLRRALDDVGRAFWESTIATDGFSETALIEALLNSPEYKMINKVPFPEMVHKARQAWIATVGSATRILDIGGSSPNIDQGAMIELGYQHRPQELVIFDLPPNEQYWGLPKYPQDRQYSFSWGKLEYVHGRCEAIETVEVLGKQEFDMVFMGQVIEHVLPKSVPNLLSWIREHLTENGRFIFDTPNRLVTRIQSPDSFIDIDHKIEYSPAQLRKILSDVGFKIVREIGMLPMPQTISSNCFNPLETYEHNLLSDYVENCYLFAFECEPSEFSSKCTVAGKGQVL